MKPVSPSASTHASLFPFQSSDESHGESRLTAKGAYVCPVCRHGNIEQLVLMDAFACGFCRHIFEADFEQQTVRVVDSSQGSQAMIWRWNGRSWRSRRVLDGNLTLFLWLISVALVLLPGSMIGVSLYIFPPLEGNPLPWFPLAWVVCTFALHLLLVSWLLAEHYQPTLYVMAKLRLRRFMSLLLET